MAIFYKNSISLIFLLLSLNFLSAQYQIDLNAKPDIKKPGYHLIFSDDFTTLDTTVWDRSCPGNDGWNYDSPNFCKAEIFGFVPTNKSNVLPPTPDSILPIQIRRGEERGLCDFSSGEIKTYRVGDPSNQFRNWKIYPNSLVEVRMKVPKCRGIGSAAWLFGPSNENQNEIDFLETFGENTTTYQTNFIYGKSGRVKMSSERVRLTDSTRQTIDISENFLTYATGFDARNRIDFFVNNAPVGSVRQGRNGIFPNFRKRVQPFDLRIGLGNSTLDKTTVKDCDQFPSLLLVDFVRIYIREGERAVQMMLNSTNEMRLRNDYSWNDGAGFAVSYFPKAKYEWDEIEHFKIDHTGHETEDNLQYYWVSVLPGTPLGEYNLSLTVSFQSGYKEILPLKITVWDGK